MKAKFVFGFMAVLVLMMPVTTAYMYGHGDQMQRDKRMQPDMRQAQSQPSMQRDSTYRQQRARQDYDPHGELFNRFDYRNLNPIFQHYYARDQRSLERAHQNYLSQLRNLHERLHKQMHYYRSY